MNPSWTMNFKTSSILTCNLRWRKSIPLTLLQLKLFYHVEHSTPNVQGWMQKNIQIWETKWLTNIFGKIFQLAGKTLISRRFRRLYIFCHFMDTLTKRVQFSSNKEIERVTGANPWINKSIRSVVGKELIEYKAYQKVSTLKNWKTFQKSRTKLKKLVWSSKKRPDNEKCKRLWTFRVHFMKIWLKPREWRKLNKSFWNWSTTHRCCNFIQQRFRTDRCKHCEIKPIFL